MEASKKRLCVQLKRPESDVPSWKSGSVPSDMILMGIIYLCAAISMFLVVGIVVYVFVRGIRSINWTFLTTVQNTKTGTFGIAGNLLNTLYIIILSLLIATPLGIGAAIYLNEYAKPGKLVRAIEFTTETLSGIPSIIFGMFGMVFLRNNAASGLLHPYRSLDTDAFDPAADHEKYSGGTSDRTGQLSKRCTWNRCDKVVYDPDDPAAVGHAWNYHGCHSCHRPNCRRVSRTYFYRRKRLYPSEDHRRSLSQDPGIRRNSDDPDVFKHEQGKV